MKVLEEVGGFESDNVKDPSSLLQRLDDKDNSSQDGRTTWLGVARVTPELYLCGASVVNASLLRALQVTCVVNCAPELPPTPAPDHVECVRVKLLDTPTDDVSRHIDHVADVIERVRECGGRTLVHCVAGVSRSAALCLGYLVKYENLSLRGAFQHLRAQRPAVKPNCGFFRQLIEYEAKTTGCASVKMVFNEITKSEIPDLYEADYQNMLYYQAHYNRRFGRN